MTDEVTETDSGNGSGDTPPPVVPPADPPHPPEPATVTFQDRRGSGNDRRQGGRRAGEAPPAGGPPPGEVDYDKLAETMEARAKAREEEAAREAEVANAPKDEPPAREHWAYKKRKKRNG